MAYAKTAWVDDSSPYINANNLNNMENGIEEGVTHAESPHAPVDAEANLPNTVVDASYVHTDNNYTTAEKSKLAATETSSQLDTRDTANRDRANHTGTQTASTISDFASAVKTNETVTSLSLATNTLSYTDESGTVTTLDLSLYLDDTNLARLTSGTIDGATGIATFTRDDGSTFTVDMSALLDDTTVTVEDVLTSTSTTNALSANMGKQLQDTKVGSDITTIPTGSIVTNMFKCTQAEYDGITPDANTFYIIVG